MRESVAQTSVAIVGGGPRGAGLLERLLANAEELLPAGGLTIHVIEPFPFGTGRIWRWDQSPLLWANSQAEDMTMFTDDSSTVAGPIRPGPTFEEWAKQIAPTLPLPAAAQREAQSVHGMTFASRRLVHEYLAWFFWRTVADAPPGVRVQLHRARAVDIVQTARSQLVHLVTDDEPGIPAEKGEQGGQAGHGVTAIAADVVLLAQGHLPTVVLGESAVTAQSARLAGLSYLAEEYTADSDLSLLEPGQEVAVRGAGLAFVDLAVLVAEGRGGRFVDTSEGPLRYEPSGQEPVLLVGSRRGVPYRSKITYRLQGPAVPHLRFFDSVAVEELLLGEAELDFRADVWPLLAKELAFGHYHELFAAHPEAVTGDWPQLHTALARLSWGSAELDAAIAGLVPDPADRLDIDAFDRPLRGLTFDDRDHLQKHVIDHIEADLARRRNPRHSADLAVFNALLAALEPLGRVLTSGRLSVESAVRDVPWFIGFFSYFASGPPPRRLAEIAALARAGVVRFLGPDVVVEIQPATRGADRKDAAYVASSPAVPGQVTTTSLVEARVPRNSVSGTADDLLARLFERGAVTEEVLVDVAQTRRIPTGRLLVDPSTSQVIDAAGHTHPRLYAFGSGTSAATPGAFSRPSTNAAFFRQNDASVRKVLGDLAGLASAAERHEVASVTQPGGDRIEILAHDAPSFQRYRTVLAREAASRSSAPLPSSGPSPRSTVLAVHDASGALVAAGAYEPLDGGRVELTGLWTAPARRGQGLARRIARELEHHAAERGYRHVVTRTGPRTPEVDALARSEGYRPSAQTSHTDGADGSCRLRKVLDDRPSAPAPDHIHVTDPALVGGRRVS